jgi:hypothetical protein
MGLGLEAPGFKGKPHPTAWMSGHEQRKTKLDELVQTKLQEVWEARNNIVEKKRRGLKDARKSRRRKLRE